MLIGMIIKFGSYLAPDFGVKKTVNLLFRYTLKSYFILNN